MFVVLVGHGDHLHRGHRPPGHLHLVHHHLAVPDGDLRQLRRGHGRGPGQGPGRHPAPDALGDRGPPPRPRRHRGAGAGGRRWPRATWWSARPATSSPPTARSSRASPRSTSRPSPASRPRSSASRAATARPSPAGPRCCPTASWSASPPSAGQTFLDRMITLVEGANRQKTPNEIALTILLAVLTIVFLPVVVTLQPFGHYSGATVSVVILVSLLVCLIPTTIGALLSAIGIAGMDRLVQRNVLAMSGRAVEAAGDVQTLLLDKTGTITLGNRMASDFYPGRRPQRAGAWPTPPSWPRWPTRRPRAAPSWCWPRSASTSGSASSRASHAFVPFTAHDPHVRPRHRRPPDPQGGGRVGQALGDRAGRDRPRRPRRDRRADLPGRLHPAGGGRRPRRSSGSSS